MLPGLPKQICGYHRDAVMYRSFVTSDKYLTLRLQGNRLHDDKLKLYITAFHDGNFYITILKKKVLLYLHDTLYKASLLIKCYDSINPFCPITDLVKRFYGPGWAEHVQKANRFDLYHPTRTAWSDITCNRFSFQLPTHFRLFQTERVCRRQF